VNQPGSITNSVAASQGPLSDGHLAELTRAKRAAKVIRRAAGVAWASSMTTGFFAIVATLGVVWGDLTSSLLGVTLLVIAWREGRFAARLGRFEAGSPRALAINQLALGLAVVVYALVQARFASHARSAETVGDAQVDAMLGDIGSLTQSITIGFYLCVAAIGAGCGCLMALYYSRRTNALASFLTETPAWVIEAMRAAS